MEPSALQGVLPGADVQTSQATRGPDKARAIPCLDGLRAISIFFVVMNHLLFLTERGAPGPTARNLLAAIVSNGLLGVNVFFVISGFLITTLLLQEQRRYGVISLKNFYIKRFFRIFPAYYALILVIGILTSFGWMDVARKDFLHAVTFTWIYHFAPWKWCFTHTWSLSVEEQFYLMWPLAVVVLGARRSVGLAVGFILALPFARLGFTLTSHGAFHAVCYVLLAGRFDVLMYGCLLALLWRSDCLQTLLQTRGKGETVVLLAILVLAVSSLGLLSADMTKNVVVRMFQDSVAGLGIAGIIGCLIVHPSSRIGRFLNAPPLVFIGVLSYSIYLWQQLFLTPHSPANAWQRLPLNLLGVAAVAGASFYLIERPFILLRKRWLRV